MPLSYYSWIMSDSNNVMIQAKSLTKKFGALAAVDAIDFSVKKGESFGLLGPNGAGKSTTMRMIASVSKRTGGDLSILGQDPDHAGPDIRAHLWAWPRLLKSCGMTS